MNQPPTGGRSELLRRGTLALGLLAALFPIVTLAWAWATWQLSGDEVLLWMGDRATGKLPRLTEMSKSQLGVDYYWYAIAAENAATRWWTSLVAVLGGLLLLIADGLPRAAREIRDRLPWLLTGLGMIVVGLDERFQLHEFARNRFFEPAGIADGGGFVNPGDITTLVYPVGGALLWWLLFRNLEHDRLSRGLLIAVLPIGAISIGIDVLAIDALDRYPGWVYAGLVEEFGEWEVVALMTVVAWRRLASNL